MTSGELQSFLDGVERHSLANLFYHGRRARDVITIGLFRDCAQKYSGKELSVAWIAFSPEPDGEAAQWHFVDMREADCDAAEWPDVEDSPIRSDALFADASVGRRQSEVVITDLQRWKIWERMHNGQVKALVAWAIGTELEEDLRRIVRGSVIAAFTSDDIHVRGEVKKLVLASYRSLVDKLRLMASLATRLDMSPLLAAYVFATSQVPLLLPKDEGSGSPRDHPEPAQVKSALSLDDDWFRKNRELLKREFLERVRQKFTPQGEPMIAESLERLVGWATVPGKHFLGVIENSKGRVCLLHLVRSVGDIRFAVEYICKHHEKATMGLMVFAVPSGRLLEIAKAFLADPIAGVPTEVLEISS